MTPNRDISPEGRVFPEEELGRLKQALQRAERQNAETTRELELLSYSVSHDLRAPLRAIHGFSEILLEDYQSALDEEGQRYLNTVCSNARKMNDYLDSLLDLSRLGRREMNPALIDMNALAAATIDELRATQPGVLNVTLNDLPPAWGDRSMIRMVLAELIGNAIKFSAEREQPLIEISGHPAEEGNLYTVRDNGAGFDMQFADRLFGLFQKLHSAERFSGQGCGLASVRRIVNRHQGRVWAEAEPEAGAMFTFTLPAPPDEPGPAEARSQG